MMTSRNIKHNKMMAGAILSICFATLLAMPLVARAAGDNGWQIVSGRYDASHQTSQGIAADQLGNYGFIESADGSVRVNKTVEPTGVEDEFIVHLSVDTCAVSAQQTDYYSFFKNAKYQGTTSGNNKEGSVGTIITQMTGNQNVTVSGNASDVGGTSNTGYFKIKDPNGNTIVESVQLYWSQAQQVTFYLKLKDGRYIVMAARVKGSNLNNTVQLSKEAYDAINKEIQGSTKQGPAPTLNSVTDVMGDNIEYLGPVNVDAGSVSFDGDTSMLTWNPQYSGSANKVIEDPVDHYEYTEGGAVAKHTVTQKTWYYGAASLSYKVRLKTGGLSSSYDPGSISNPYLTNNHAALDYSGSFYDINTNTFVDKSHVLVDFPKPQVKGITYDLRVLKWNKDDDAPLAGATFKLTRAWTDSYGVSHNDVVSESLMSDESGCVTVTGLPWGDYTLEEIEAPTGFVLPQDTVRTFNLCYTNNSSGLVASTISPADANRAMSASEPTRIDNERVKTDVSLVKVDASDTSKKLSGAKFSLYKDDGDGSFNSAVDKCVSADHETDDDGRIEFSKLTVGTYFLVETYAPTGYQMNGEPYRIQVFDVAGQAGGVDSNMIQVGKADGSDMRAPETPNTVTIADKPVPSMPVTAGPGTAGFRMMATCLLAAGGLAAVAAALRTIRSRM